MIEMQLIREREDKMVVIVKIKVVYRGLMKSETYAHFPDIKWIYKTRDEALHKGSQINEASLDRVGYKLMRSGKDADQYAFDMKFSGNKDIVYSAIEKQIKPLVRDRLLTDLLEF